MEVEMDFSWQLRGLYSLLCRTRLRSKVREVPPAEEERKLPVPKIEL